MAVSAPNSSSKIQTFNIQSLPLTMTQQHHHHQSKHIIKGPRPSPLAINQISHSIGKPSSTAAGAAPYHHGHHQQQQQQVRKPVIIYTHSPKIIHIKREDFMSFVQKLTGMPRSRDKDVTVSGAGTDNNLESSLSGESIISSMKQEKNNEGQSNFNNEIITSSSSAALLNNRYSSTYNYEAPDLNYTDIPLFTPNSSDFLISPYSRSTVFKQSADSPFGILGNLISPSGLEFIKELPDY